MEGRDDSDQRDRRIIETLALSFALVRDRRIQRISSAKMALVVSIAPSQPLPPQESSYC